MSRIWVKYRIAGTLAAAAALGTIGAGTAQAVTTPGIANDVSRVVVAIETPAHGLQLYWQANGTVPWHAETVAGPGTTFSAPTVTRNGSLLTIAAQGPNHRLEFYWQLGSGWHREIVAGPGSAYSAPSVATVNSSDVIAVQGAGDTLRYYWQYNVLSPWHGQAVAGPGSTFSAPSVTQAVVQGASKVVIAAEGAGQSLRAYYASSVAGPFTPQIVDGPGTAVDRPSVASDGDLVLLASEGAGGRVNFYWTSILPLWHPETVVASGATSAPSLSVNPGVSPSRINVVFRGALGSLADYWQPTGQTPGTWSGQGIGGILESAGAPSASYNTVGNLVTTEGLGSALRFYWEANGSSTWNSETVPGAVVAS